MPTRRVIIDHLTIGVSDRDASRRWYDQALAPLDFEQIGPWSEAGRGISFGLEGANDFAISEEYEVGASIRTDTTSRPFFTP